MATENRNIFQALEDYFTGQLDRRFDKDNRFGDVAARYGNELLDMSKAVAGNAGDLSFSGFREAAPEMLEPYIRAAGYFPDMAFAGLLGALGAAEKGIAAGAEILSTGNTEDEKRLARDLLGMAEAAGANPEGRMAGILAPYAQSYIKARLPDYQYAGRSLLGSGTLDERMEGVREAFTETDMLPKALSADVPIKYEGVDVPRQFYSRKGGLSPVASETDTGYYLQDGTFIPFRQAVEKYSPSVRAAEKLPQKKGKYEDLRKWMVDPNKGGANLDELQWTGADEFFAGKTVTKDEIRNYLDERTPIIETTFKEADGTIGREPPTSDEMLEEYLEFALPDEVQYYRDEYLPEMIMDNEPDVKSADDLNNALQAWRESNYSDTIDLSEYLGTMRRQEGSEAPLYPVMGKDLADMASDMGYDGINDMSDDYYKGMVHLRFDGENMEWEKFEDTDDLAQKLGYDAEEMAKDSLMEMAENEGLYSDPAYFYETILGKGDDYYGSAFYEGDTEYSQYFPAGGRQYSEKVYSLSPESPIYEYTQGSGKSPTVDMESAGHFSEDADNITAHARTASYDRAGQYSDQSVYLFGEGQSDVGQDIRKQKKTISQRLKNLYDGYPMQYPEEDIPREARLIQNDLRIRSVDQMSALNKVEEKSQQYNDDYNVNLQKQYNEFKEQFERSGDIRANVFREIMNGAPPDAFDDVIKNASKIDTKVNEEKIEAEFRRLFRVRAEDMIAQTPIKDLNAQDFKLQPNKENWTGLQDQLFGLYQAYARDVTNHVDGNPYALKLNDDSLVAPAVRSGIMNTNNNTSSGMDEFYMNKYIKENLEELKPTIKKYKLNPDDDQTVLEKIETAKYPNPKIKEYDTVQAIKNRFRKTFLKNRTFTPFDGKKMTFMEFEDMATNLNMPSMSEYNKNISSSRIKLDVDRADLERTDDYKKAFPDTAVEYGANEPPDTDVRYKNLPPLTEKTNKWLDMTLKNNLYDAIQSGDKWFALPNADMVYNKTGGKVRGHEGFYEGIAPKRLEKIIKKIDKNAKLEKLDINTEADPKLRVREPVLGVRLSPEFIKNAAKKGIPQLGVVGGVGLMDFMVRDNKDGRNDSLLAY